MKVIVLVVIFNAAVVEGLQWDSVQCSADADQQVPEGIVPKLGRFPWLGILQHTFSIGDKESFAVTGAVLIHPAYALAPAEDVAKIPFATLRNSTVMVLWTDPDSKFALEVVDYLLHPDFREEVTYATVALVELDTRGRTGFGGAASPVLPICMPYKGALTISEAMYSVQMTDVDGVIQKEVRKMDYMEDDKCNDFYRKNKLMYEKMIPVSPICAVAHHMSKPCVWDGGSVLIARATWGHWKILGFGVRGPGCGAPARYLSIASTLGWIDDMISKLPASDNEDELRVLYRRLSPIKLIMYRADDPIPRTMGQCDKDHRGNVLFKESDELNVNKNIVQGFYFVSVDQIAAVSCLSVILTCTARTNAALWIEHNCHRDNTGIQRKTNRIECFMYFKSSAYVEFRFFFSFRATIEVTMYGQTDHRKFIPNPFISSESTEHWYPTARVIKWDTFFPYYKRYWHL